MLKLINAFVDIGLLRRGPQDLPYSRPFMIGSLVLYVIAGFFFSQVAEPPALAMLVSVASLVLLVTLLRLALALRRHLERLVQTLTAFAGVDSLLTLIAWPIWAWIHRASEAEADFGFPLLVLFILIVWSIAVYGHILRHALEIPMAAGVGLAILYMVIAETVMSMLMPVQG
jgi:hypothetical protein